MTGALLAVAVFVKTPGHSSLKTRLARDAGMLCAETFHRLSSRAVASVLAEASAVLDLQPYWAVAEAGAIGDPMWREFPAVAQGDGDLGARLHTVYTLLRRRHHAVIFVGADSPQIDVDRIRQAYIALAGDQPAAVLGRCSDGGFYICGANVSVTHEIWTDVAYGTSRAAADWFTNISQIAPVVELEALFDIDYAVDLPRLKAALSAKVEHLTRAQVSLLKWLTEAIGV